MFEKPVFGKQAVCSRLKTGSQATFRGQSPCKPLRTAHHSVEVLTMYTHITVTAAEMSSRHSYLVPCQQALAAAMRQLVGCRSWRSIMNRCALGNGLLGASHMAGHLFQIPQFCFGSCRL
jgi:integral membrane sensor domain MASE1